ncbi:uncharacterized protein [Elaeis guineensis]|uniref:uncharacterized protein n=1 Tax=Elaeis guineensis var. tenera TaxID=51953 RepID=UPI003C6CD522
MGLLDDEKEYIDGIVEASSWASAEYLRPLQLTDEELKNYALIEIENLLQRNERSLADFESMPYPDINRAQKGSNKLMHDELSYNRSILVEELQYLLNSLIDEQRCIYNKVISAVNSNDGSVFFVYGYGGTDDLIKVIVESTYPNILKNINDLNYFQERAILAPTLLNVDVVNEYMLSMIPEEERIYLSFDSVCRADANVDSMDNLYTIEYLNSIRMSGLSNHTLKLKVGAPVMLLRNIDKSLELCINYQSTREARA